MAKLEAELGSPCPEEHTTPFSLKKWNTEKNYYDQRKFCNSSDGLVRKSYTQSKI